MDPIKKIQSNKYKTFLTRLPLCPLLYIFPKVLFRLNNPPRMLSSLRRTPRWSFLSLFYVNFLYVLLQVCLGPTFFPIIRTTTKDQTFWLLVPAVIDNVSP